MTTLISTAEDMSHYLAMYLSEGRYHGKVLLSTDGIAQMHHAEISVRRRCMPVEPRI